MTSLYDSPIQLQEHTLRLVRKQVAAQEAFPQCLLEGLEVETMDHILYGMLVRMRAYVLGEELPPHKVTESKIVELGSPATWWQHFKHTYADRWWMRRHARKHPVRIQISQERVTLTARWENFAAYPWEKHITPAPAYFAEPVRLQWVTTHIASEREGI